MRASQFFISTLKEAPSDAEVISQRLMLRAGYIRRLAAGVYSWLPMGLRCLRKVETIVREEMNRTGAIELFMPAVQPAELWRESGRWEHYGPELLRFKDRHARDFVIGPTHEEVITDIARRELRSYRQLPKHFYQIQTKFRDEIRPRFGVMRGREFIMKDGYSFHADFADLEREYRVMFAAYTRIFARLGLAFRSVAADTGSIGGEGSHEFHVLAESGEDSIAYCPTSDFAANVELAEALAPAAARAAPSAPLAKVKTPGQMRCEDVAAFLAVPLTQIVKAIAVMREVGEDAAQRFTLLLLRGDHELNEVKTQKALGKFRFAQDSEIREHLGCSAGYIGPLLAASAPSQVDIVADRAVTVLADFVCGANQFDHHYTQVNWARDLPLPTTVLDLRNVVAGDPSPDGKGVLAICRGIEVGHIFQLRTKYSAALNCTFLDENGKPQVMEMGCYGIGVTRIVGAAIEQGHDDKGIILPPAIAPFALVIVPLGYGKSAKVKSAAEALYHELVGRGVDVILDDRDERPGSMLADWELIGIPQRVVIGERSLNEGFVEYQGRRENTATRMALGEAAAFIAKKLMT